MPGYEVVLANPGTKCRLQTDRTIALADAMPSAEIAGPIADASGFKSTDAMRCAFSRILGVTAAECATRFRSPLSHTSMSEKPMS